jgi:putative membrane protein
MSPHVHIEQSPWQISVLLTLALLIAASLYLRGWIDLRSPSASAIPAWKAGSFFLGLFFIWMATESRLAAYDHSLLTAHMVKHLILMTLAPALILIGEPLRAVFFKTSKFAQNPSAGSFSRQLVHSLARIFTRPAFCWIVSALALVVWHVPALLTLGMLSATWHAVAQATFFGAGLLFWWPVIQPWPSTSTGPRWSMLLYLFLATLPCDILAGFLVFSDRVVYPVYLSTPRLFGFSVLEDQQCAAALMWTCVTLIYLVLAAIICSKLLTPRTSHRPDFQHSQVSGATVPQSGPRISEGI